MVLKHYQSTLIDAWGGFLRRSRELASPAAAFQESTAADDGFRVPYNPFPGAEMTPYVCLRVPTGGGKTLIAGHAIRRVQADYLGSDFLLTIWLVPSEPIKDQTIAALRTPGALLHDDLNDSLGAFNVLEIDEALSVQPSTLNAGHVIIVATIQSFKQDTEEGLRVYRQNGDLMSHLIGNDTDSSLAAVIRARRPFIIVDEAHSQGSPLALATLSRLAPSCILELTATPDRTSQPSNVLRSVSASTLQSEDMLKLPLRLATNAEWQTTMKVAIAQLRALEVKAQEEEALTGEVLRPIVMLIQAERRMAGRENMTPEKVKRHLIDDYQIDMGQIAIATGAVDELSHRGPGEDYPQFIITVDKLREGWDCPNAYILFSFRNTTSATAVEQILGRVLRMPNVKRKCNEELNQSYAFVVSSSLAETAEGLRDGMVRSGFERYDTRRMIQLPTDDELEFPQELVIQLPEDEDGVVLPDMASFSVLPQSLQDRIEMSGETGTMTIVGAIDANTAGSLADTFGASSSFVLSQLANQPVSVPRELHTPAELGHVVSFPLLGFTEGGQFEVFDETALLDSGWTIDEFDWKLLPEDFEDDKGLMRRMELSMNDRQRVQIESIEKLDNDVALFEKELGWDSLALVAWLDREIPFAYVERSKKVAWIDKAVSYLVNDRGLTIDELGYRKFRLRGALARKLADSLRMAEQGAFDIYLANSPESFSVRDEFAVTLQNGRYAYDYPYNGNMKLKRHFFPEIGNLKSSGEELACAQILANEVENVDWWVRNVERKHNSFWLQLPQARFYPDFLAKLKDGTFVAIEYKGAHLAETRESQEKERIGNLWAARSDGKCQFLWITNQNWAKLRQGLGSSARH